MARGVPKVKQRDISDCGPACLASIAAHHGHRISVSRVRQLASTNQRGTSIMGLVDAATSLGFAARGVKGAFESMTRVPLPAIAHVVMTEARLQHYLVVVRIARRRVIVMDPGDGQLHRMSHDEFKKRWSGVLVILSPDARLQPHDDTTSVFRRYWDLVGPHRAAMSQALVGATVYTLLGLSTSIYVQKIVDHVVVDGNASLLNLLSVSMLALLLLQTFIGVSKSIITLRTGQLIDGRLILAYYTHLLRLPQGFFDSMRVGELTSRVNDAAKIRAFINDVVLDMLVNALVVVFSISLLVVYDIKLALATLLLLPVFALIFWAANRYNRGNARQLMERASDIQSHFVESLGAAATVKRLGLESHCALRMEARLVRMLRSVYGAGMANILAGNATQLAARAATVGVLWFGTTLVIGHHLTAGELMSCYALMGYMTGPLTSLAGMNRTIQDAMIAADRLFEIMELAPEPDSPGIELRPGAPLGDVRFESVRFRYGARECVFSDLDLVIAAGQVTAIVGESGSGKSTIGLILQRVYRPDAGRVLIGGMELSHLSVESLRRVIGVVPQTIDLFAGTIAENIAVGEFEPDLRRVYDLCAQLGISAFIDRLPQGLNTEIGENGTMLSGGQRQRVAVARALYRQPQVLILDEAASALDSASECYVRDVVRQYRAAGKTVVVIAHRLSAVMDADAIVVLRQGAVVERGRHHELMDREGEYSRMWQSQFPRARIVSDAAD